MAQLLGPDGRPVRKDVLTREIVRPDAAAPAIAGVRQVFAPDPSAGLTPRRLAQLLRASEQGDAEEYLALAERMEEKDLHYLAVLGTRKRAVAQLDLVVEPAGDDADSHASAEIVRAWLKRLTLDEELEDILDAVGKGFSVSELVWETSERDWSIRKIEWVDPRWFEIDRVDGRTLRLRGPERPQDLQPWKFLVHVHKAKSGLPIRGGLARVAGWAYLFKNYDVKDWVAFAEIYGQPLRVGKYPPNATTDDRKTLLRAVANLGTDAAAIVPEGMLIEFVKAEQSGSSSLYKDLARFMDEQISKGVLGQTLTTEVSAEGGSRAQATVHDQVRADIRRSDKKKLAATLTEQIARPLVELNRGPQKAYPQIKLMEPESHDPAKVLENADKAARLGLRISKADVLKKSGLKEADPDDPDDAIEPPQERPSSNEARKPGALPEKPNGKELPPQRAKATAAARESGARPDSADQYTPLLDSAAAPSMDELIDRVRQLVDEARDMRDLSDRLLDLYPALDVATLADALRLGLAAAELAGRSEIIDQERA